MGQAYDGRQEEDSAAPFRLVVEASSKGGKMTFRRRYHVRLVDRVRHWITGSRGHTSSIVFA
jgi:hypothetical protein